VDFKLTEEQEMMRDSVRRLVEREVNPVLERHARDRSLPKDEFRRLLESFAGLGLTAPRIPESGGGSGIRMLDYGLMFEHIPPAIGMSLMAQDACISRLYAECSPEQRARFLPDLIAGRRIGCTGSTEPDAGSDPRGIKTRLTRDAKGLRLNGRKMWITNVSICDLMIVTCLDARSGESAPNKVVKVVLERERTPFEAREIDTIGLNQGFLGEAVFEDCLVPEENVIESARGGTQVLMTSWNVNRPLVGLMAAHMAQKAFDIALEYSRMRRQFGKPIGAHQLIQKNLSDVETAIVTSRLVCYRALSLIDQGATADAASAMSKRYSQMACRDAVWQAMNVLGAMGLSVEARVEALYRDIRMLAIPDGTNEILALIHGRELTGLEAFRGIARPGS